MSEERYRLPEPSTGETVELTVATGFKVRVRPLDGAVYELAKQRASQQLGELLRQQELAREELGDDADLGGLPDLREDAASAALMTAGIKLHLGILCIESWDLYPARARGAASVADEKPVPVSPAMIKALFDSRPMVAETFYLKLTGALAERAAEGNGSGASPNGTGGKAAAPTTAETASRRKAGAAAAAPT